MPVGRLATVGLMLLVAQTALALDVPPLRARVNDLAGLLSDAEATRVEALLTRVEQKTQAQMAVLTVRSLDGDVIESFSMRVVEAWKLGKSGRDDGLLLLVSRDDRKIRIEVGYGLEGVITDAYSAKVIRNILTPSFRRAEFGPGIERAMAALAAAATGEQAAVESTVAEGAEGGGQGWTVVLSVLFFLLFPLGSLLTRRHPLLAGMVGGAILGGHHSGSRGGFSNHGSGFSGGGGGFGGGGASGSW